MLQSPLSFTHTLLSHHLTPGDTVIDATIGHGHDALFLKRCIGPAGFLYGFDIQQHALDQTIQRLQKAQLHQNVHLFCKGHETMASVLPNTCSASAIMFNLGYLPKTDKTIITSPTTTCQALQISTQLLKKGGYITVMVYHGHPGGREEKHAVMQLMSNLDQRKFTVMQYSPINQINHPPFLLVAQKL